MPDSNSSEISPTTKLRLRDGLALEEIDGELVILDLDADCYFGTNEVGADIVRCLQGGASEDEIVAELAESYAANPETLREDVRQFMRHLEASGLFADSA